MNYVHVDCNDAIVALPSKYVSKLSSWIFLDMFGMWSSFDDASLFLKLDGVFIISRY